MNISTELSNSLLYQSENEIFHDKYSKELNFYNAVKTGDLAAVKKLISPLASDGMGKLSDNSLNNIRYHFIVSVAMITRFCIEGGMPSETAYTLSDLYIRNADKNHSCESIAELHKQMVFDFTTRMQTIQKPVNSKIVANAIEFIHKNIRNPIQLEEIADAANVSTCYLSTLFKKETGDTVTTFMQKARIEEAKNMLKFTDMELIDISNYFCFSSHSYFIVIFKKYTGMTPKVYRNKYHSSQWKKEKK